MRSVVACLALFLIFLEAMNLTGWAEHNHDAQDHGEATISLDYLRTGDFFEATFENWESEFLQMAAYVMLTAFLVQKRLGRVEGPGLEVRDDEDPAAHGSTRRAMAGPSRWRLAQASTRTRSSSRSSSCSSLSMVGHALGGVAAYNSEQAAHGRVPISGRVRAHGRVLVPVVPELAERVPRGVRDRDALDLPASGGLARVEAGARTHEENWVRTGVGPRSGYEVQVVVEL